MKRYLVFILCLLVLPARAELVIEITSGRDNPTSIAVVPFAWSGWGGAPEDVAAVVGADLLRSGQFDPVAREDMLSLPTREADVYFRDWRTTDVEYLLIGRVSGGSSITVEYELFDVYKQERVLSASATGPAEELRMLAHQVSDSVYEQLTGIRGAFATRILYVAVTPRVNAKSTYRLTVADSDGARARVVFESSEPVLSPAWAPGGEWIAYVSFETNRPAIYRHNLVTDEREQMTNFKGLNGAPAFSPDGNDLAMVLSKDGNPDIYIMDLQTRNLLRVTRHYSIDTEPNWMPDGRSLIFTSDRGGRPQIYRVDIMTGRTERVTYEGPWNARASMSADGLTMVMVQQNDGQYHVAAQDLVQNRVQILTQTTLDESPSVAPNGSMILYATKYGERGILAAVSVDGGVKFRLPSREGEVREPAWSPYLGKP
jgi:TolB protein